MQKPQIVAYFFVPANPYASEAMHPTMGAFHHPPPGLQTGRLLPRLGLLAPCPTRRRAPACVQQLADLVIVIAFGQTQPLGAVRGRLA